MQFRKKCYVEPILPAELRKRRSEYIPVSMHSPVFAPALSVVIFIDEALVRKYIEQIKIFEDHFMVCFKAKLEIGIQR